MLKRNRSGLILIISFILVLTLPNIVSAENIYLTKDEISKLKPDTIGMLNNGVGEVVVYLGDYDESETVKKEIQVAYFNTWDFDVEVEVYSEKYWEERREHSVRGNYTYGSIPNPDWVTTPTKIIIKADSKYIVTARLNIPVSNLLEDEERDGGGYICLLTARPIGVETAPSQKLFITLFGEASPAPPPAPPIEIPGWALWVALGIIGLIVAFFIFSRFKFTREEDEEYDDDYDIFDDEEEVYAFG
jgi:hypothetical protein